MSEVYLVVLSYLCESFSDTDYLEDFSAILNEPTAFGYTSVLANKLCTLLLVLLIEGA